MGELRLSDDIGMELASLRSGKPNKAPQPYGKIKLSSKTPVVERDLSLVFSNDVHSAQIEKSICKAGGKLVKGVWCKDVYVIDENQRSLAYGIQLQDAEETLQDSQIQKVMDDVVSALKKEFGAELRS